MDSNSICTIIGADKTMLVEVVKVIPTLIGAGAAIFASFVAIYGIKSWRREFRGKRRIELAEEILSLSYEARDVIKAIRNPFSYENEGSTRQPSGGETPEEKRIRDNAYVVFERYSKHQEMFNKLFSLRYRFMTMFGKDKAAPIEEIQKALKKIFFAAENIVLLREIRTDNYSEQQQKDHLKQIREYEAVFWWIKSEKDEIAKSVDKAVYDIEQFCGNIIMGNID